VPCIIFDSEPIIFIDLLIFYVFRIFLNEANKYSHASGDMSSTTYDLNILCFLFKYAIYIQIDASSAVTHHHVLLLSYAF
jgi:hypothetical protein